MKKLDLKIGDKVYDQILFPDKEGEVIDIENHLLVIEFNGKNYHFPFKDDGTYEEENHFPVQLSKTPYQIIGKTDIFNNYKRK